MEAVEHTLNGNPDFGRSATVTILRNGDLAGRTCLKVELNSVDLERALKVDCEGEAPKVAYVRRLGHALLKEVEVEIGGSRIDRQYGVWMDIWYELTHTTSKERGYRAMIGDVDALTQLRTVYNTTNEALGSTEIPEYTLYIPLQFWFNRNPGLALPLIALQYHEVRLNFEFEDVQKLLVWSGSEAPDFRAFSMKNASVLVDYIYLDSEERRRFAQVGHEYLIEQLQFTGVESVTGANTKLKLGFNHPCKEIVWALRNGYFNGSAAKKGGNRFLCYTHDDASWSTAALQEAADNLARGMVYPSASDVPADCESQNVDLPAVGESVCTTVTFPSGTIKVTVVVSDCLPSASGAAASTLPSSMGSTFSIVENALAGLLIKSSNVTALGANKIHEITVSVDLDAAGGWSCYGVRADSHSLTLGDVSVPVGCFAMDCRSTTSSGFNPYDVSVVQLSNYGLRLDGMGNPVEQANIQLNGHDRFDYQEGSYFNYVQPDAHHTRTPADGINVYSFALHPEQHQPSGTANLSRIDNTQLNVTFGDNIRSETEAAFDLFTGSLFYVFAVNYNVLRIMSGMGGLSGTKNSNSFAISLLVSVMGTKAIRRYEASHNGKLVWTLAKLLNTMSIASKLFIACETPCRSGNPLEPIVLRSCDESPRLAENKNSGIVKINRIGQSACLLPKSHLIMIHGRASETERVTVNSFINYWLKIQSTPLEKFRGIKEPMLTKHHILYYKYHYGCLSFINLNNKTFII